MLNLIKRHEGYKPFLPETPIQGHIGYYPCGKEEDWYRLPLPLRCATWYEGKIEAIIFDTWLENYKISAKIEVHPQHVFKALFTLSNGDTQLYSVCGIRFKDGKRTFAKWWQDATSGAFAITDLSGHVYGKQGGYKQHFPANVEIKSDGSYNLNYGRCEPGTHCHFS